jgi:hypothetical protein
MPKRKKDAISEGHENEETADSPKKKKAEEDEDPELIEQVATVLKAFYRASLNWTGGDDDLEFKRSKLSLVQGKSYSDPDNEDEVLVITRKDGLQFTETFLQSFRPSLLKIINEIVDANNAWLEATNYREARLNQKSIEHFLKVFLNPEVPDDGRYEDDEVGIREGAIGFRRESGNLIGRWDYTEACDCAEAYKDEEKGSGKPLAYITE